MKSNVRYLKVLACGSAAADHISCSLRPQRPRREGWVVIETTMAYRALVKRLNGAVKAEKMRVVTRASASSGAKNRKLVIPGNMIVGVISQ